MGLYIRKAVSVGPFRFNLSKSGVGISAGVKGLRVGTGPRGNYIHMGRGGLYYRAALPSGSKTSQGPVPRKVSPGSIKPEAHNDTYEALQDIDSGAVGEMVDSSSKEILAELNRKRKGFRVWPLVAATSAVAMAYGYITGAPSWALYATLFCGAAITAISYYFDLLRKTTVMLYDIEDDASQVIEELHFAYGQMKGCKATWHLEAEGGVKDSKYHAGATNLVSRKNITLTLKETLINRPDLG